MVHQHTCRVWVSDNADRGFRGVLAGDHGRIIVEPIHAHVRARGLATGDGTESVLSIYIVLLCSADLVVLLMCVKTGSGGTP